MLSTFIVNNSISVDKPNFNFHDATYLIVFDSLLLQNVMLNSLASYIRDWHLHTLRRALQALR